MFVRFLKLIGTAVPDGLELHRKLRRSAPQRHRLEADIRKWINAW